MGERYYQMVEGYKTLVIGASLNPDRYSNKAVLMLLHVTQEDQAVEVMIS